MRIQFDIKYRPQIESGEYKVETRNGLPVRIICWDRKYGYPIVGLAYEKATGCESYVSAYEDGTTSANGKMELSDDLFIVTSEPELNEFEENIFKLLRQYKECDIPLTPENIKAEASMLWQDFEKYFFDLYGKKGEGDSALIRFYDKGLADGKAEALKEIEQDPESSYAFKRGVEYGKEEALKDLPRWKRIGRGNNYSSETKFTINGRYLEMNDLLNDVYEVSLSELKKLPRED